MAGRTKHRTPSMRGGREPSREPSFWLDQGGVGGAAPAAWIGRDGGLPSCLCAAEGGGVVLAATRLDRGKGESGRLGALTLVLTEMTLFGFLGGDWEKNGAV